MALLALLLRRGQSGPPEANPGVALLLRSQVLHRGHPQSAALHHDSPLPRCDPLRPFHVWCQVARSSAPPALTCLYSFRSLPPLADTPLLGRLLRGFKRLRPSPPSKRQALTTTILNGLRSKVSASRADTVLWALLCTGVYGLFRLGEITVKNGSSQPLTMESYTRVSDDHRSIHLAASKTDIAREGVTIHLYRNGSASCPVAALDAMFALKIHKVSDAPLFPNDNGKPFTFDAAVSSMRDLLTRGGVSIAGFSGHSLRKGGAQSLFEAGVCDQDIATLGRWSSNCYRLYFSLTHAARAAFSSKMSRSFLGVSKALDFSRFSTY